MWVHGVGGWGSRQETRCNNGKSSNHCLGAVDLSMYFFSGTDRILKPLRLGTPICEEHLIMSPGVSVFRHVSRYLMSAL